jgi:PIN domain nuclease of toxin-antitoxin system
MIILDTHAWIRWLHPEMGQPLPAQLHDALRNTKKIVGVSLISCLEVSQLVKKGSLKLPVSLPEWFNEALSVSQIELVDLTPEILYASTKLPDIHKDPADRIIISSAIHHKALLVSADATIKLYPNLECVWTQVERLMEV